MKVATTILLLVLSNAFMTFAWYGHLKKGGYGEKSWLWVILLSWCIAFFEYCLMVPANKIGFSANLTTAQLKIIQEVITLCVFVPFSLIYMNEHWKWDYLWAFFCVLGAVFFVNREQIMG